MAEETFHVHEVLRSSGRKLVANQTRAAQKKARNAIQKGPLAAFPFALEVHAVETGEEVDPIGGNPQLDDLTGLDEVGGAKTEFSKPESAQGRHDSVGVFYRRGDKKVEVAGEAGSPVESEAKGAGDQVFNAMGVE
jgi:hypothetical protein